MARKKMFQRFGPAIVSALVCAGLSACSPISAPQAQEDSIIEGIQVDSAAKALLPERYRNGVNVAMTVPDPPMALYGIHNDVIGLDPDLAQALGKKLGVPFRIHEQEWVSIVPSLQAGRNDIMISNVNDLVPRRAYLKFVDYMNTGFYILVNKGNPKHINTLIDLCGKKVSVMKATSMFTTLTDAQPMCADAGRPPITLVEVPSQNLSLLAMRSGRTDASYSNAPAAIYSARYGGDGTYFDWVDDPNYPGGFNQIYVGITTLHKDADLVPALSAALKSLMDDGTYMKLLEKWDLQSFAISEPVLH